MDIKVLLIKFDFKLERLWRPVTKTLNLNRRIESIRSNLFNRINRYSRLLFFYSRLLFFGQKHWQAEPKAAE